MILIQALLIIWLLRSSLLHPVIHLRQGEGRINKVMDWNVVFNVISSFFRFIHKILGCTYLIFNIIFILSQKEQYKY
jgi:hypothetical protein